MFSPSDDLTFKNAEILALRTEGDDADCQMEEMKTKMNEMETQLKTQQETHEKELELLRNNLHNAYCCETWLFQVLADSEQKIKEKDAKIVELMTELEKKTGMMEVYKARNDRFVEQLETLEQEHEEAYDLLEKELTASYKKVADLEKVLEVKTENVQKTENVVEKLDKAGQQKLVTEFMKTSVQLEKDLAKLMKRLMKGDVDSEDDDDDVEDSENSESDAKDDDDDVTKNSENPEDVKEDYVDSSVSNSDANDSDDDVEDSEDSANSEFDDNDSDDDVTDDSEESGKSDDDWSDLGENSDQEVV